VLSSLLAKVSHLNTWRQEVNIMSRPLRIQYSDAWYHVLNRGRRGEDIFQDDTDLQAFITVLREASVLWNVKIAAYCLMANHYHLLLQTPDANLSRCMRHIDGVYTQRYNRRHAVDGPVFRGRYRSILVDGEAYLIDLVRYIHFNPVKAGLVRHPSDYRWSSFQGYCSEDRSWDWLDQSTILRKLGVTSSERLNVTNHPLAVETSKAVYAFFEKKNQPAVLGSDAFIKKVKSQLVTGRLHSEIPETKRLAPRREEILQSVCRYFQVEEDSLLKERRGRQNTPRDIAIYLTRYLTSKRLQTIANDFGIKSYSSISSALARAEKCIAADPDLQTFIEQTLSHRT
jgi:putative transposase